MVQAKTKYSPFATNLVAEKQRNDERAAFKVREEERRQRARQARKARAKKDIIMKALAEESDLDALRREKVAIQMEERRLKALLDLERAKLRTKEDRMSAQRAERHRQQAKRDHAREIHNRKVREQKEREMDMLRRKLDVPPEPAFTF